MPLKRMQVSEIKSDQFKKAFTEIEQFGYERFMNEWLGFDGRNVVKMIYEENEFAYYRCMVDKYERFTIDGIEDIDYVTLTHDGTPVLFTIDTEDHRRYCYIMNL